MEPVYGATVHLCMHVVPTVVKLASNFRHTLLLLGKDDGQQVQAKCKRSASLSASRLRGLSGLCHTMNSLQPRTKDGNIRTRRRKFSPMGDNASAICMFFWQRSVKKANTSTQRLCMVYQK
eukprot:3554616-Amphidinium_carterae.1